MHRLIPLVLLPLLVQSAVKIWKFNVEINDLKNRDQSSDHNNCKSVIFAPHNTAEVSLDRDLVTETLVLPIDGIINIQDDTSIVFRQDNVGCTILKPLLSHNWYDPDSWYSVFNSTEATPHVERVPCDHDAVVFHSNGNNGIVAPGGVEVITVEGLYVNPVFMFPYEAPFDDHTLIRGTTIRVQPERCKDPMGCQCRQDNSVDICDHWTNDNQHQPQCHKPITPIGFCQPICGAFITLEPRPGFNFEHFQGQLHDVYHQSDFYMSRIDEGTIQIVFNGLGPSEVDFSKQVPTNDRYYNLRYSQSGPLFSATASIGGGTAFVVLGTLALVLIVMAVIFYIGNGHQTRTRWTPLDLVMSRINRGTTFFARFDNNDQELIIDHQEVARSFDNPLYGEAKEGGSVVENVDPLYEVSLKGIDHQEKKKEVIDDEDEVD